MYMYMYVPFAVLFIIPLFCSHKCDTACTVHDKQSKANIYTQLLHIAKHSSCAKKLHTEYLTSSMYMYMYISFFFEKRKSCPAY